MKRSASYLIDFFRELFRGIPGFIEDKLSKKVRFVRDYPEKNLRIIVTAPIARDQTESQGLVHRLVSGMHIEFAVEFEKATCLEFRDSRVDYTDSWTRFTTKKVETLIYLVENAPRCPTCGSLMFPEKSTDHQVNPRGTSFVWYTCSGKKCGGHATTEYRIGLKTAVSKYIKRD